LRAFCILLAFAAFLAAPLGALGDGPSFNCARAKRPAELAICGNAKLSELDRILVAGYNYIKEAEGLASADRIGKPYYFERLACGADIECIGKSQINEITDLAAAGAPISLPDWLTKAEPTSSTVTYVPLASSGGGTFLVPVTINEQITLKFVLDSGAADVSIPADVVLTLMRTGSLTESDFLGNQTYKLADGSTTPSQTFKIRSLRVGDRVLNDVVGSIAPVEGALLLGQSFLSRFHSWSIDNAKHALVLR
jgi:uncharacterized protein